MRPLQVLGGLSGQVVSDRPSNTVQSKSLLGSLWNPTGSGSNLRLLVWGQPSLGLQETLERLPGVRKLSL